MTNVISPSESVATATPSSATATIAEAPSRTRRNWSAAEKADCLALFRDSGMSQSDFAKEMKIPAASLSVWVRQEKGGAAGDSNDEEDGALIEVGTVKVFLPGGIRLEVATPVPTKASVVAFSATASAGPSASV